MAELRTEIAEFDDFVLLDIEEEYSKLPYKTLAFLKAAYALYDSEFYVKAAVVVKFYYEPVTGRKFRSKNEVLYYLEHGTTKRANKKAENGDLPFEVEEAIDGRLNLTNEPPPKPLNFDFLNVLEKVTWTGINSLEDAWWPSIGDYKIHESVSQDWDRVFTLLTAENVGKMTF